MSPITLGILAASGAASVGDYELITSTVLTSSAASVTFSNLNTAAVAYKHLQIRMVARTSDASTFNDCYMRFNGDTSSNYSWHEVYGFNGSASSYGVASQSRIDIATLTGNNASANLFCPTIVDILDWQSTTKTKTARSLSGMNVDNSNNVLALFSGAWFSTSAINSILLYPSAGNFVANSRFSLYGLRG